MTWADAKYEELMNKKAQGIPWTVDDYEAYVYCEECFAEGARDEEYLGHWSIY